MTLLLLRTITSGIPASDDFLAWPNRTNAVQFRLATNASPGASRLFATFEIEAYGEVLLSCPERLLNPPPTNPGAHNFLVNGRGPELLPENQPRLTGEVAGPGWQYASLDFGSAYRATLREFSRGILYVEPDLFVLYDHLAAKEPATLQMMLRLPNTAQVDPIWGDLRLEMAKAGMRVHAPAARKQPRNWERIESSPERALAESVTFRLGPTNQVSDLNLITVFAVHPRDKKPDLAFRLLESTTAIGARIHRDGYPTLVAFRTAPGGSNASLTGFEFRGPVGVDVFKPKRSSR